MINYREILRMGANPVFSKSKMEQVLHCSHHTIDETLAAAKAKGVRWPLDENVTNEMLKDLLFPDKGARGVVYEEPDVGETMIVCVFLEQGALVLNGIRLAIQVVFIAESAI